MRRYLGLIGFFPIALWATSSIYCPGNYQYISVGMSQAQVIAACGAPMKKETSQKPYQQTIPVMQLIYNSVGSAKAFYGVWSIPVGVASGARLEVDVVDNKVYGARVNGAASNAFSMCGGASILKGDPVGKVYTACGSPSVINNTYITKDEPDAGYPEIWTYTFDNQPSIRLTFIRGSLESIN